MVAATGDPVFITTTTKFRFEHKTQTKPKQKFFKSKTNKKNELLLQLVPTPTSLG